MAFLKRRPLLRLLLYFSATIIILTLPFRWLPPPATSFMVQAKYWGLAGEKPCQRIARHWTPWSAISPSLPLAVVAAEDQLFPVHWGLDLTAIATALEERQRGRRIRGASTITQQLVKNLYLWPGQSWLRKAIEAGLALVLEATWPKRRILEVYINSVQFDSCIFGVEAASQRFFHKPAALLTSREAAQLAAVLPNPARLSVNPPSPYVQQRTDWILGQMQSLGGANYLEGL